MSLTGSGPVLLGSRQPTTQQLTLLAPGLQGPHSLPIRDSIQSLRLLNSLDYGWPSTAPPSPSGAASIPSLWQEQKITSLSSEDQWLHAMGYIIGMIFSVMMQQDMLLVHLACSFAFYTIYYISISNLSIDC